MTAALWEKSGGELAEIVALDVAAVNEKAIARFRQKSQPPIAPDRVRFLHADFSHGLAAMGDGTVDGVVSGLAIQYAESRSGDGWDSSAYDRLLVDINRVLRPGGTFVFSVNVPEPAWGKVALFGFPAVFRAPRPLKFLKNSLRMLRYGSWLKGEARRGRFHYLPRTAVLAKLEKAGFVDIEARLSFAGQAYVFRGRRALDVTGPAGQTHLSWLQKCIEPEVCVVFHQPGDAWNGHRISSRFLGTRYISEGNHVKALIRWRLVVLALLIVGLVTGARYYLSSRHAATQVANRLQGMFGVDVHVGEVAIGLGGSSSLKDVEIFEAPGPDGAAPAAPFVAFESIHADVSALDLLGDKTSPQDLTLNTPAVMLRFDRAGNLLTRLPVSNGGTPRLPRVVVVNGTVTFQQEGREPFRIRGLAGELATTEVGFKVDGQIDDPDLGKWEVHATYHTGEGRVALTLNAPTLSFPASLMKRLPFVPPQIQEALVCEGRVGVNCQLTLFTDGKAPTYRATVEPHGLRVKILEPGRDKPAFALGGVDGKLTITSSADGPTINADLRDRNWGRWLVDANWSALDEQIILTLGTPTEAPLQITAKRLQALPLDDDLRKMIARTVDIDGSLGINLRAALSTASRNRLAFRLELEPRDLRLHLRNLEPPLELDHLDGKMTLIGSEFGVGLTGELSDKAWGRWLIGGGYEETKEVFTLDLRTPPGQRVAISRARLRQVPQVPSVVWDEVQIDDGDTTVAFRLSMPMSGPSHYRLDLDPRNTRLHIRSIGLDAAKVEGRVVVDDRVVQLRGVRGVAAQGDVNLEAHLDFRQPWYLPPTAAHSALTFDIKASKLRTRELPDSWNLPRLLAGHITGEARLTVYLDGLTPPCTVGQGGGTLDLGARLGAIKLILRADAKRGIRIDPVVQQGMATGRNRAPDRNISEIPRFDSPFMAPPMAEEIGDSRSKL